MHLVSIIVCLTTLQFTLCSSELDWMKPLNATEMRLCEQVCETICSHMESYGKLNEIMKDVERKQKKGFRIRNFPKDLLIRYYNEAKDCIKNALRRILEQSKLPKWTQCVSPQICFQKDIAWLKSFGIHV